MTSKRSLGTMLVTILLVGCGSDTSAPAPADVRETGFVVKGQFSERSTAVTDALLVTLTDFADACEAALGASANHEHYRNVRVLNFLFQTGVAGVLEPDTFDVEATSTAATSLTVQYTLSDEDCATEGNLLTGASGSIELERVDSAGAAGTYSVTFDDDSKLEGSFDAPNCAAPMSSPTSGNDEPKGCVSL